MDPVQKTDSWVEFKTSLNLVRESRPSECHSQSRSGRDPGCRTPRHPDRFRSEAPKCQGSVIQHPKSKAPKSQDPNQHTAKPSGCPTAALPKSETPDHPAAEIRRAGLPNVGMRTAGPPDRRSAGAPDLRTAGPPDRRSAGPPDRRVPAFGSLVVRECRNVDRRGAGPPDRHSAGPPDRRSTGEPPSATPDRQAVGIRSAGPPDRRTAGPLKRRAAQLPRSGPSGSELPRFQNSNCQGAGIQLPKC